MTKKTQSARSDDSDNETQSQGYMKDNIIYNQADNFLYVKSEGNKIVVVCNRESQQEDVMKRMTTDTCVLDSYEEWDEDEDMKWILTFKIIDEMDSKVEYN